MSDSEQVLSEQLFSNGGNTSFLLNNTKENAELDESLFGQHILDTFPGWKQEVPKMLKSWCILLQRILQESTCCTWRG